MTVTTGLCLKYELPITDGYSYIEDTDAYCDNAADLFDFTCAEGETDPEVLYFCNETSPRYNVLPTMFVTCDPDTCNEDNCKAA